MSSAHLKWHIDDTGFSFLLVDQSDANVKITDWARYDILTKNGKGSVGPLLAKINDNDKLEQTDTKIKLSHEQIAAFSNSDISSLGLPPPAPFRLKIKADGQIARPGFSIEYLLLRYDGRPTLGLKRNGVLCEFAGRMYLLLDPLYSIIKGIEFFQAHPPESADDRMVAWGKLKELLPEDSVVDNQLKSVNIVRADRFTLDIDKDDFFHPVLLTSENNLETEHTGIKTTLPEVQQERLSQQFASRTDARSHYAIGDGWYVVIPERLRDSLQVVREAQKKSRPERKSFMANPASHIRGKLLGEDFNEDTEQDIEAIFVETPEFLSSRIKYLGEWEPKICAYKLDSRNKWLPDEDILLNVLIGDSIFEISFTEAEQLLDKLPEAIKANQESVEVNGKEIPANEESFEVLNRIVNFNRKEGEGTADTISTKPPVPIIESNIEEVEFEGQERKAFKDTIGDLPGCLKTRPLFAYQQSGLEWLQNHMISGSSGALLADDMGLGKTLQSMTFLAWIAEKMDSEIYPKKPFLIVAPTGLLKNWRDEAEKHLHTPGLGIPFEAFGPGLRSFKDMSLIQRTQKMQNSEWVLTSYETLRDKIQFFISVDWAVVVFDEAQKIKNPVARVTEMAKSLKADFTLMLTGTPVENELKDLWCIVDTAIPGYLGSLKDFHYSYEKTAHDNPDSTEELKNKLTIGSNPPKMMRRMKEDHLEGLPEKIEKVLHVEMPNDQATKYSAIVQEAIRSKGLRGAMLKALQHMRNCSLFAAEVGPEGLTDENAIQSARLAGTLEILDNIQAKGEKALLFVESIKLQELLVPYLQKRYGMPHYPLRISGQDDGLIRKRKVDEFQGGRDGQFDIMILSPKAGGVGLTLTAANHVIHLSRWWNPAVEDQCTDRVFRIGQTRKVYVYYPLAIHPVIRENSFDINLHSLLERKRTLSRSVLVPSIMTSEDYEELYNKSLKID